MANGLVFNIGAAPTITKILPFIGIASGIALAKYQKKDCLGCFLGYSMSGMILFGLPLLYIAKEAGDKLPA